MDQINIISAYQSVQAYETLDRKDNRLKRNFDLKVHEGKCLERFIGELKSHEAHFGCYNGYFIGYKIKQINKEFDLLRVSDDLVINIELKSSLGGGVELQKIEAQLMKNYYYLKFLAKKLLLFTYVEGDGLYIYDEQSEGIQKTTMDVLVSALSEQNIMYNINLDDQFVPNNYLVSPFNKPESFLNDEYFLTSHQAEVKEKILGLLNTGEHRMFCISANAGTGKTLLIYDIAKTLIRNKKNPLIIHCGKLNPGHHRLDRTGGHVIPICRINKGTIRIMDSNPPSLIILDESQRISEGQLDLLIEGSIELNIPILFSYDTRQYLKQGENKDIYKHLQENNPEIIVNQYELTNKIRTNKEIASFIYNMMWIGKSRENLDYKDITIVYFEEKEDVKAYIESLEWKSWKAITFTAFPDGGDPILNLADICGTNAHHVIGQEFEKVVLVMDSNFNYSEEGELKTSENYYSPKGMLYQIITRVVCELEIVVLDNPALFFELLGIKNLSFLGSNSTREDV